VVSGIEIVASSFSSSSAASVLVISGGDVVGRAIVFVLIFSKGYQ